MICLIGIKQEQNFCCATPWMHLLRSLHSWASPTWQMWGLPQIQLFFLSGQCKRSVPTLAYAPIYSTDVRRVPGCVITLCNTCKCQARRWRSDPTHLLSNQSKCLKLWPLLFTWHSFLYLLYIYHTCFSACREWSRSKIHLKLSFRNPTERFWASQAG